MNKKNREIIIKSCFGRFPFNLFKTINNFRSIAKQKLNSSFPCKLQIESSGICNLKCRMCPQNNMKRKKGFLTFKLFKKIYDEIKPPYLNLTGFGEPLLNPEIFRIIDYAKRDGSYVKLDTNAILLDDSNSKKLLDSKIDIVSISLDGIDKKTYEKIRIGANFERVIDNIKNFIKIKKEKKSKTEIHLFLVLQKDNILDFSKFIKFGQEIGVNSISGTFISEESYEKNNKYNIEKCNTGELKKLSEELKVLQKYSKTNLEIDGIIDAIDNFEKNKKKDLSKAPCYKPWYSPFIYWDGTLVLCCYCVDGEIIIGDLKEEKFKDLWNSTKMKQMREMVSKNRRGICLTCGSDETYIRDSLKKIPFP